MVDEMYFMLLKDGKLRDFKYLLIGLFFVGALWISV